MSASKSHVCCATIFTLGHRLRVWSQKIIWCALTVRAALFYLDASLFFSLRDRGRAVSGSSLTGVRSLITLFSLRSSVPICSSLRGLGVRSSTSVRRDFFSIYFPSGRHGREGVRDGYRITHRMNVTMKHKLPLGLFHTMSIFHSFSAHWITFRSLRRVLTAVSSKRIFHWVALADTSSISVTSRSVVTGKMIVSCFGPKPMNNYFIFKCRKQVVLLLWMI